MTGTLNRVNEVVLCDPATTDPAITLRVTVGDALLAIELPDGAGFVRADLAVGVENGALVVYIWDEARRVEGDDAEPRQRIVLVPQL